MSLKKKNKSRVSGINFEDKINIISTELPGNHIFVWLYQIALVLFGICGIVIAIVGGFTLPVHKGLLIATTLLSVVYYFFLFHFRKYLLYTVPMTLILFAFTADRYKLLIVNGFYHVENVIIDIIYEYFGVDMGYFITREEKTASITMFFLVLIQIISFLFTITVQSGSLKYFSFMLIGAALGGPIFLGKVPSFWAFFLCLLFILLSSQAEPNPGGFFGKKRDQEEEQETEYEQDIRLKSGIYMAGTFLILSILLWSFGSDKQYQKLYNIQQKQAKKLEKAIENFSLTELWESLKSGVQDVFFSDKKFLFETEKEMGGLSGGKLSKSGSVSFTNETALKLTLPKESATLYLKGYVGTHYTGESWERLTSAERNQYERLMEAQEGNIRMAQEQTCAILSMLMGQAVIFPDMKSPISIKTREITIDYITANQDFLYLPYVTQTEKLDNIQPVEDSYYIPAKRTDSYFLNYYTLDLEKIMQSWSGIDLFSNQMQEKEFTIVDKDLFLEYASFEEAYRDYVYQIYAKEPEGLERLQALAEQLHALEPKADRKEVVENNDYILKQVQRVKNYLEWQTTYSLSPGVKPEEEDFAEYFLFDSRKGYCAHYATTAVLLLRYLNIPARYVEGYVVTRQDILNGIESGVSTSGQMILSSQSLEQIEETLVTVEVKDTNAHAWIEVYFDGFGWLPVEVTAGYSEGTEIDSLLPEVEAAIEDKPTPTRLPTNTPTPTKDITPVQTPSLTQAPTTNPTIEGDGQAENKESSNFVLPAGVKQSIIAFSLAAILLFGIYWSSKVRRKRILDGMSQPDRRKAALNIYTELERLLNVMSVQQEKSEGYLCFAERLSEYPWLPEEFQTALNIALCAGFSGEEISAEEIEKMQLCYEALRKNVYCIQGRKHLRFWYLKYILAL